MCMRPRTPTTRLLGAACVRRAVVDARVCAEKLLVVVVAAIAAVLAVLHARGSALVESLNSRFFYLVD